MPFLLLFQILMFFAAPVVNGISRLEEHAADVYGLEIIRGIVPNSAAVAAHAFQVDWSITFAVLAVLSMTLGNFAALTSRWRGLISGPRSGRTWRRSCQPSAASGQ